jgi:hypothetical protein
MKVKAKEMGFYDLKRRYEGEVFILHDPKLFSDRWMEKVGGKPKKAAADPVMDEDDLADDISLEEDVI